MTAKRILCYLQQMKIQRCKKFLVLEVPDCSSKRNAPRLYNEIYDNLNHHGIQNMITTFSLQQTQLEESLDKILLPPTDPSAEVIPIRNSQFAIRNYLNCELRTGNCELFWSLPQELSSVQGSFHDWGDISAY